MTLRMLEISHPYLEKDAMLEFMEDVDITAIWQDRISEKELITHVVLSSSEVDLVIEALKGHFTRPDQLKIVILPIEGYYPRREVEGTEADGPSLEGKVRRARYSRTSIEEIYKDASDMSEMSIVYMAMIAIAGIVASVGLLLDDVAVIIGSMVIAPLLGPNLAFTLAITLGDSRLARVALITSVSGYILAILVGLAFGLLFDVDPQGPQLIVRTEFSLLMTLVALASGVAGALSFSQGVPQSLVGVMVAVALLPPLAASGLFLGSAQWDEAVGSLLLFSINVISINLAGIVTFSLMGVTPSTWWEKDKARRTTKRAIIAWTVLMVVVIGLVVLRQRILEFVP